MLCDDLFRIDVYTVSGRNNVARQGYSALAQTRKQTIGPFNWLSLLVCGALATLFSLVTV
jgi:hypothetical protein